MNSRKEQEKLLRSAYKLEHWLRVYIYSLLRDWDETADVLQETFISISLNWEKVPPDKLKAWLKRVARNRSLDLLRKRQRRQPLQEELFHMVEEQFSRHATGEFCEEQKRRKKALRSCLGKMKKQHIELLDKFYYQRVSCEQLARDSERSANAWRILLSRLRVRLRDCIDLRLSGERT